MTVLVPSRAAGRGLRLRGALWALALPVLGSGCAGDSSGGAARLEARVDTLDGVERLLYPASPGPTLPWRFDTLAIVGGFGADGDGYQFDDVGVQLLAGSPDGDLYVADGAGRRVLRYDATGTFVEAFGREGAGPGELQRPTGLDLGPGDTLWISDSGNRRTMLIPVDGGAPRSIPMADDASILAGRIVARGELFFGVNRVFSFSPGQAPDAVPPYRLVGFDRAGEARDSVWASPGPAMTSVTLRTTGGMMMLLMSARFVPAFRWRALSGNEFVVSDQAAYDFRLVRADGTMSRRIERDPAPRAVTQADRDAERARIRKESEESSRGPSDEKLLEQRLAKTTFADLVPRISGLAVDGEDRVWVGVSEETPEEVERIDVYDRRGLLLGEIAGDPLLPDLFYGPGLAAKLGRDDLDVQQIVILRLVTD